MRLRRGYFLCSFLMTLCIGCDEKPAVPFKPHSARVRQLLAQRHQRFADVTSVYAEFEEISEDEIWKETETRSGALRYAHPNQGRLDSTGKDSGSLIATGAGEIWVCRNSRKQIMVLPLETPVKPLCDLGLIPAAYQWLLPVSPGLFDSRQELEIVCETEEDVHLKGRCCQPGLQATDRSPDGIEVVLDKQTMFPRRIVWTCGTGSERLTTRFTLIKTNLPIDPSEFAPSCPEGWQVSRWVSLRPGMTSFEFLSGPKGE